MSESLNHYQQARDLLNKCCESLLGLSLDDLPDIPEVGDAVEEIADALENGDKPDMKQFNMGFFTMIAEG